MPLSFKPIYAPLDGSFNGISVDNRKFKIFQYKQTFTSKGNQPKMQKPNFEHAFFTIKEDSSRLSMTLAGLLKIETEYETRCIKTKFSFTFFGLLCGMGNVLLNFEESSFTTPSSLWLKFLSLMLF